MAVYPTSVSQRQHERLDLFKHKPVPLVVEVVHAVLLGEAAVPGLARRPAVILHVAVAEEAIVLPESGESAGANASSIRKWPLPFASAVRGASIAARHAAPRMQTAIDFKNAFLAMISY
jgi:hypothetical protein